MQATVDHLINKFHSDRQLIGQNDQNDVAVVFISSHVTDYLKETHAVDIFRQSTGEKLFMPFGDLAQQNPENAICYVLKRNSASGGDFEPFYCTGGSTLGAIMHYRVEFEILMRKLFEKNYKYIMKPIVVGVSHARQR